MHCSGAGELQQIGKVVRGEHYLLRDSIFHVEGNTDEHPSVRASRTQRGRWAVQDGQAGVGDAKSSQQVTVRPVGSFRSHKLPRIGPLDQRLNIDSKLRAADQELQSLRKKRELARKNRTPSPQKHSRTSYNRLNVARRITSRSSLHRDEQYSARIDEFPEKWGPSRMSRELKNDQ